VNRKRKKKKKPTFDDCFRSRRFRTAAASLNPKIPQLAWVQQRSGDGRRCGLLVWVQRNGGAASWQEFDSEGPAPVITLHLVRLLPDPVDVDELLGGGLRGTRGIGVGRRLCDAAKTIQAVSRRRTSKVERFAVEACRIWTSPT